MFNDAVHGSGTGLPSINGLNVMAKTFEMPFPLNGEDSGVSN